MRDILIKVLQGAGFGAGATLVFFISITIHDSYRHELRDAFGPTYIPYHEINDTGLEIIFDKQRSDTEAFTVVGEMKNNGKYSWKEINLTIELLEDGKVIDKCRGVVDRGNYINPNESGYFKITCDDTPTKNSNYKYSIKTTFALAREINA